MMSDGAWVGFIWFLTPKPFDGHRRVSEEAPSSRGRLIDRLHVADANKGAFGSVGIKMNVAVPGPSDRA